MEIEIVLFFFIAFSADGALYEECGVVTRSGSKELIAGGNSAQRGEVPWHSGIYFKSTTTMHYKLICGGSLIKNNMIISAAHCFWKTGMMPANYAVGVGQLQRAWNDKSIEEMNARQRSDVKEIHLPAHYQGGLANNQADIAVVVVTTKFKCTATVRPVCMDFDSNLDYKQLKSGNKGKVAGWGFTSADGELTQGLQVLELPYVDTTTCLNQTSYVFRPYVTVDKFCAGYINASRAVCEGDSGGGLVFPESDKLPIRYYLRGIVSSAPVSDNKCSVNDYATFTSLLMHEHFIKDIWRNNINDNETFCVLEPREHQREGCGWSYPRGGVNNVTSGAEVQYGEFPWTCAILKIKSVTDRSGGVTKRDVFVSAGALIHPAVVLVAGYSLDTGRRFSVRAGVWSGASTAGGRRGQLRDVETVERQGNESYFLTLLFLTEPMTLAPNVAVACLPPPDQRIPPGTACVVTPLDRKPNQVYSLIYRLSKTPLSVMERDSCERELIRTEQISEGDTMYDELSCMTLPGRERTVNYTTCQDMGIQNSPVSCSIESKDDRYVLQGFIWNSFNCASDPFWDYVDLSQLRTWIDGAVTAKGYTTTSYSVDFH